MQWLDCRRAEPFFLYLRYGDPHTPYAAPSPFAEMFYDGDPTMKNRGSLDEFYERPLKSYLIDDWLTPVARDLPGAQGSRIEDIEWCRAQYDAEVRFVDDGVAALLAHLEQRGLTENTTVIIVGDHGESLGEHGIYFEHHGLYDCTIRPPLIIRRPGAGNSESPRRRRWRTLRRRCWSLPASTFPRRWKADRSCHCWMERLRARRMHRSSAAKPPGCASGRSSRTATS
jgi:arylsulfatase A-like enzyme